MHGVVVLVLDTQHMGAQGNGYNNVEFVCIISQKSIPAGGDEN